jgi:hypothetical protein
MSAKAAMWVKVAAFAAVFAVANKQKRTARPFTRPSVAHPGGKEPRHTRAFRAARVLPGESGR